MEIVLLLIRQNIIMAIYMAFGYFLYKKKIITKTGSGELGKTLLYLVMPMAIIKSYIREFSLDLLIGFVLSFVLSLLALILAILISRYCFRNTSVIKQFGCAFSNAGFIGIPLVQMVLGDEAVFYVASFVALLNILQWTYGVFIFTRDKSVVRIGKIISNPILIALEAGLVLFFLPIQLPNEISTVISTLASMNGPLAMIVLGTYLAQIRLCDLFKEKETYLCSAVRLILIPIATMLLLLILPDKFETLTLALMFAAAAPVGTNVAIFAQIYKQDYTEAVKDVCMSTVLSIFSMPVITLLMNIL